MTQRDAANPTLGGKVIAIAGGPRIETFIEGPTDPLASEIERLTIPLTIRPQAPAALELELPGDRVRVEIGRWSR
jgi:hypothetical protein